MARLLDLVRVRSVTSEAWLAYLEKVAADPGYAPSDGLPSYMGGFSPTELYIEPDVEKSAPLPARDDERKRQRPNARESEGPQSESTPKRSSEVLDSNESQLYGDRPREEVRRIAWKHELAALQPGGRAAVIGPPGQGKSLLTWMSAARQARESYAQLKSQSIGADAIKLPIFASLPRLCEFEVVSGESPEETVRRALMRSIKSLGVHANAKLACKIADSAHEPRMFLWLDALDEVGEERGEQLNLIISALGTWQCRVVITSRPYGLTKWSLPFKKETLTQYRLAPFLPHQSEAFVEKRFERNSRKRDEMRKALRHNHSLQLFAQNPFLLTLGCRLLEEGESIPDDMTRGQLYKSAIKTMFPTPQRANDWFPTLSSLAWKMQTQFPDDPHITDGDLIKALRERDREVLCPLPSKPRRLSPIRQLAEELSRLRVLVPSGKDDVWIWPHRSFGEFLAGRHIAEAVADKSWNEARLRDPVSRRDYKISHWLERRSWLETWADTIVFAAGQMIDPSPLLERLGDEEQDDDYRHRLALACRCIPEFDGSRTVASPAASATMDAVATEAWQLVWRDGKLLEVISPLWGSLGAVMRTSCRIEGKPAQSVLIELLNDRKLKSLKAAADTLGRLGAAVATPEVVSTLLGLLGHENLIVRQIVAEALGGLGAAAATPEVVSALLNLLENESLLYVRRSAADALGRLGAAAATPEVVSALLRQMSQEDEDSLMRRDASKALGGLGAAAATPEVFSVILGLLCHKHPNARGCALDVFSGLGAAAALPEVFKSLLGLSSHEDQYVRSSVAEAIGNLGAAATPEAVSALLGQLRDENKWVRRSAVEGLGKLGTTAATPQVITTLTRLLSDEDSLACDSIAQTLGRLGAPATPDVLNALLGLLGNENWWVRRSAVEGLGKLGAAAATPEVIRALLGVLGDDAGKGQRYAAEALGRLGSRAANSETLRRMLAMLSDPDSQNRIAAVQALGRLGAAAAMPGVVNALLGLENDEAGWVRVSVAEAFCDLGPIAATPEVVNALQRLLSQEDWLVRSSAASALGAILKLGFRWRLSSWLRHVKDLSKL